MGYITYLNLSSSIQEHRANVADRTRRVKALGTDIHTILNAMAPEHTEGIVKLRQTLIRRLISTISQKPIRLQQAGRSDKSIGIPPERRTACRTASAKNALVESIELGSVFRRL